MLWEWTDWILHSSQLIQALSIPCENAGGKNGVPADVLLGIMELCLASPAPGVDSIPMGYAKRISAGQFNASVRGSLKLC